MLRLQVLQHGSADRLGQRALETGTASTTRFRLLSAAVRKQLNLKMQYATLSEYYQVIRKAQVRRTAFYCCSTHCSVARPIPGGEEVRLANAEPRLPAVR